MIKKFLAAILLVALGFCGNIDSVVASETTGSIVVGAQTGTADGIIKAAPTASPAAGEYHVTKTVSLAASGSTAICYTTDGTTTPVCSGTTACSAGTKYAAAVSIAETTTLKSRACYGDATSGPVASDVYTLTCETATVSGGTVAAYPGCAITCNSGYTLSGSACNVNSSGSGSIGGGGGGGGASTSGASLSIGAGGGSVNLAASGNNPGVKFTAPAGALSGATTVSISKVYASSSTYVPPAAATGLFMVGGAVYQITATSGSNNITNFAVPVTLTFTYTDAQIPAGTLEAGLKIYYYDTVSKTWVAVVSTVNPATNTITATVNHLTQFAILGTGSGAATGGAMTQSAKLALIAQIQAALNSLIAQLKAKIGEMIAKGEYVSPALMAFAPGATTTVQTNPAGKITKGWALGQTSKEIEAMQAILAKDPAIYPEGTINGYFGPSTLAAIKKFQEKYGLAKPGDAGYGYVGPVTRAKLNAM